MPLPDPHRLRHPTVAGLFYPSDPGELAREVQLYLAGAVEAAKGWPKAVIAPHAGYVYSGPVAGSAFAAWRGSEQARTVRRIVLLGPAHRVALEGLAIPQAGRFETPLGELTVDAGLAEAVGALPQVTVDDLPHHGEHSLEVELPFLQTVFPGARVLPLVVGRAAPEEVAEVLDLVWGGRETVIVVSSDLSHYLDYDAARESDQRTADAILACAAPLEPLSACGAAPINGLLVCARRRGLEIEAVDLRSSGDTAGDRDRVVGYGAFLFFERTPSEALLDIAVRAIQGAVGLGAPEPAQPTPHELRELGACFVTLRHQGELRGCIGTVDPHRSLAEDVASNARAAALEDPRFPPLSEGGLDGLEIEISILSPLAPMDVHTKTELLAALRPGIDGVCVEARGRRAVFLPQVWDSLPEPDAFVRKLLAKAGLPPDEWPDDLRWWRFTVESTGGPAR